MLAGRAFTLRQQFVEDAGRHQLSSQIAALGRALLVLHAPEDDTVDIANAEQIFAAAAYPKSFVSLDGVDHLVTGRADAARVAALIAAWSAPYIDAVPDGVDGGAAHA
jgi:putative redox protein